jgi:hypothetical protein
MEIKSFSLQSIGSIEEKTLQEGAWILDIQYIDGMVWLNAVIDPNTAEYENRKFLTMKLESGRRSSNRIPVDLYDLIYIDSCKDTERATFYVFEVNPQA